MCNKAICVLAKSVDPTGKQWIAKEQNSIHCESQAFITKVGPMRLRCIKAALSSKLVADDTHEDDSTFDPMEVEMADNSTDAQEFDPADLFEKNLEFINQVCASSEAPMYFHKLFWKEKLPPLQLLKWVHTLTGLQYMISLLICLMNLACNKFTLLTDDDDSVPILMSPKTYQLFKLMECEWCLLEPILDGLRELAFSC